MEDIEAFERANIRRRRIIFTGAALFFAAPFLYIGVTCYKRHERDVAREAEYRKSIELAPAEIEELKASVAESRKAIASARDGWKKLSHETLAAIVPGDAPCSSVQFDAPTAQARQSYIEYGSIDANYFGSGSYVTYPAREPLPADPFKRDAESVEELAKVIEANKADRNNTSGLGRVAEPFVFVVVEHDLPPHVNSGIIGPSSFTPGELSGRAYVYAPAMQQIVCAGTVAARNSESIEFKYTYYEGNPLDRDMKARMAAQSQLGRDLEMKIREAIARSLRVVQ